MIFTGWVYDHLLPHAQQVKAAHPLMLRAIAARPRRGMIGLICRLLFPLRLHRIEL
jgi:hypothetical protein